MANVSKVGILVLAIVVLVGGFGVGFLVGYFNNWKSSEDPTLQGVPKKIIQDGEPDIMDKMFAEMDKENIRKYLRELTKHPHMAGTPADFEQADMLRQFWLDSGLDHAVLTPYNVLLSYPGKERPNRVTLYGTSGQVIHQAQVFEKPLTAEHNQSGVVPPYNAFSGTGSPKGQLVYVNYARVNDFKQLSDLNGAAFLSGKICIARYGKIFRGDKARLAEKHGCTGLILYSDPADYAIQGMDSVYPNTWYLPPSGVQRGGITRTDGDIQTPGYPSVESAYRTPLNLLPLPNIPIHPIGYGDAMEFLRHMDGVEVPSSWRGKLPITYRHGPGFKSPAKEIEMDITNLKLNKTTYNAFGLIRGSLEPDRYVLLGNHRDSWVFGAVDPSSGTAAMMELSRVMGKLVKTGWRPRRSIVFCSWGAEEQGLVGSREWVEHFGNILSARAVAYLNIDIAVYGNYSFRGRGLPLLHNIMYEVGKKVPNPDPEEIRNGRKTLYDTWVARDPGPEKSEVEVKPYIATLGSGSDFAPFITKVGVSCVDIRYYLNRALGLSSYPLYHSAYETFHLVNNIMDPTFKFHLATAQYWGELARALADSLILPMDVTEYPVQVRSYLSRILEKYGRTINSEGFTDSFTHITEALEKFKKAAKGFKDRLDKVNRKNPLEVRMVNDQLMLVERAFIEPQGLPNRPLKRNILFAPSIHDNYAGSVFPGLMDTLYELEDAQYEYLKEDKRKVVAKHMSVIAFHMETAASALEDAMNFMSVNLA